MTIILESPSDIVAIIHEEHELVLCNACTEDFKEKHKHFYDQLTQTPIFAKNVGIHEKCDRCHGNLLTTEF